MILKRALRILPIAGLILLGASAPIGVAACNASDATGSCCKVCRTGKACGDTCIEASKTCTRGAGCACNG